MNINDSVKPYTRLSNYSNLLGNEVILYAYSKEEYNIDYQIKYLKIFCNSNNLKIKEIYIDYFGSNKLENKINLKKLLESNSNINVLITNLDRLSRNLNDMLDIENKCSKNKINFYDINSNKFVFDKYFEIIKNLQRNGDDKLQRKLNVLYIEPNKLPEKRTIKNTLEEKQKLVNGSIEYTYLSDSNDIAIVCNDEGKILGLPPNRDIGHDVICGNFFIVGDDPELGEDRSLTEEQIEKYSKYFGKESIEKTKEKMQQIINDELFF
jgi:hypothetical protein